MTWSELMVIKCEVKYRYSICHESSEILRCGPSFLLKPGKILTVFFVLFGL